MGDGCLVDVGEVRRDGMLKCGHVLARQYVVVRESWGIVIVILHN